MGDSTIPADMWGALLRIEGSTSRSEAKIDALTGELRAVGVRVDNTERDIREVRQTVDGIVAERKIMVGQFNTYMTRTDGLEDWRKAVQTTTRNTTAAIRVVWAIFGVQTVGMLTWIVTNYLHAH